jgi:tetratricopeptide (TPR) repeat protein
LDSDPNYAQAHSGLALCYYVLALMGAKPAGEMTQLANAAAEKALALDPSDSESHAVLATMAGIFDYDWNRSEKHHLKSVAVEHVSPRARFCYALFYLLPKDRAAEAIEQSRLALQSDPLSLLFHYGLAWCLYAAGEHGEAIAAARRALEIDPNFHLTWLALGFAQLSAGLPDEAAASFSRVLEVAPWLNIGAAGCLAAAYSLAGDDARGRELARQFGRPGPLSIGHAIYYAAVGDADAMFEALESAYQRREMYLLWLNRLPSFDRYRADPRYRNLLTRMNLA